MRSSGGQFSRGQFSVYPPAKCVIPAADNIKNTQFSKHFFKKYREQNITAPEHPRKN